MATQSMIIALADAIAAALNAAQSPTPPAVSPFVEAFTASVKFAPINDLSKVADGTILLHLLPMDDSESRLGGGAYPRFHGTYIIDAVLYAKVGFDSGDPDDTKCRTLMDLKQQIRDYLKPARFSVPTGVRPTNATMEDIDGDPAYAGWSLLQQGVFVSCQTLKWSIPA